MAIRNPNDNESIKDYDELQTEGINNNEVSLYQDFARMDFPNGGVIANGEIANITNSAIRTNGYLIARSGGVGILKEAFYEITLNLWLATPAAKLGDRLWVMIRKGGVAIAQSIIYPAVGAMYVQLVIPPTLLRLGTSGDISIDMAITGYTGNISINTGSGQTNTSFYTIKKVADI